MKKLAGLLIFTVLILINLSTFVLAETEKKAWLGVIIGKSEQKEFSTSIMVKEVEAGSPAEKAGIKKGDLINSINKKKTKSPIHFIREMNALSSGDKVEIELIRDKKYIAKTVTLSSKTFDLGKAEKRVAKPYSLGFYGISTRDKKEIRINYYPRKITDKYLFAGSKDETMIVTCLKKGSRAEIAGIKLYDEIISIDGKDIKDTPSLNYSEKREIKVKLLRSGKMIEVKVVPELWDDLGKLPYICVGEYKEYECSSVIKIAIDRRPDDYWERIFSCLEEKNALTIPFGPIQKDLDWMKVKTLTNIIKVYTSKETRNVQKLDHYLPITSEILNEIDIYLNKGDGTNKNKDKDPIALTQYKKLRRYVSHAIKYAQVKGLKNVDVFQMNDGTISGYKKAITYLINKNQKISHQKNTYIFIEAFNPLWDHGEMEFIKTNWSKAIKLIDWKSPSSTDITTFRIFYNLGDLYSSEAKYEESIKYYEMGINKLNEWAKDLPPSRPYAVYKRRMHVKKSFQVSSFAMKKYNTNYDNKYLKMIEKDLKDLEKEIKYFYSLPIKIKKEIRVRNPKHLFDIYYAMSTSNAFLQRTDKTYEFAIKGLNEIEKYSIGKNRNADLFGAYHMLIIASIGNNYLNDAVYYLNQSKNIALQLVGSREGVQTVGNFISFQLPFFINAGLYAEAENLINYVYDFMVFDEEDVVGKMQSDIFNYSLGRINLIKKDYPKAISHFELASVNYLENPEAGIYKMYSAYSNLLLLEAYIENKDFVRFEKQFELITGNKPINYASLDTSYDLIGSSIGRYHFIPSEIDISMLATLLKYLEKKEIKISKKDSKEFFSHLKDYFKDYVPGEESRLEMIRNSVKASSLLASGDLKSSETFLLGIIPEIKDEYSSELYNSNLTPIHKIDDIIEGYLNASYYSKNKKFFDKSYKIIQVVSNSITTKDIKKSIKTKKFQDPEDNKLIEVYQKLQIEKVSFTSAKEFDLSTAGETTYEERELFDVGRSKEIDDEMKNLEKKIKAKIPSYFKKIKPTGASLKQIQKKLSESQALIEYFFFEDKFYILIIKKDNHKILKINNTLEDLEKSAQKLKLSISINDQGYLEKFNTLEGYRIYKAIFAPIENYISKQSEIIVIPNKFLKNIPLHLLPTTKTEKCMDCSNVEWLMNKYDFAYLPNAEFFTLQKNKKIDLANLIIKTNKPIFLGIGNPNLKISKEIDTQKLTKRIDKLSKILSRGSYIRETNMIKDIYGLVEGSQEELETIQEYLKPSKSKLLLWDDANENNIKNMNLKDFKIIHFATHGELAGAIKGQNEPFLVLSPPDIGTNENDGILSMSEIMNLENNAELVILSACNTAAGNIKQSEGFSGLARAFLFSGSKSVLVSNWYVETYAAMELTTGMMKQIKDNPKTSGSKALTGSMKNFISNNKEKSHPFYWAPFVIVGLNSNININ